MLTAIHREREADAASEMLMTKLFGTNVQQMIAKLALELIPEAGLLEPAAADATMGIGDFTPGRWVSHYMFSLALRDRRRRLERAAQHHRRARARSAARSPTLASASARSSRTSLPTETS